MTGAELVAFARGKLKTPYVYGMKGAVMTAANYAYLKRAYGNYVWESDRKKIGMVCVDCSGLISWATGRKLGSAQLFARAIRKEPITTIATAPIGALVWRKGHVGIYSGTKKGLPFYIAADGSAFGVREVPLSENAFSHWLLMDGMVYEEDEMVEREKLIVDEEVFMVDIIRKDGVTYIKTRDIAEILGLDVSNQGKTPVLAHKK